MQTIEKGLVKHRRARRDHVQPTARSRNIADRENSPVNPSRWFDATTGRWLSEDPIGFAGGDPNLFRYADNSPPNATDPTGLVQKVVIWINTANMPSDFNVAAVESQINATLKAAGVTVPVIVKQTTAPKSNALRGWFEMGSNQWQNYVEFEKRIDRIPHSAYSHAGWTEICQPYILLQNGVNAANMTMAYANILIHEVFWLGVLDESDDGSAKKNSLQSPYFSPTDPREISPSQARRINESVPGISNAPNPTLQDLGRESIWPGGGVY